MEEIINAIYGIVPEVLYYYFYLVIVLNLKEKRKILFLYITVLYIICITIPNYNIIFYVIYIILIYVGLKIIYKDKIKILDFFVIFISMLYMVIAYSTAYLISNGEYSKYNFAMFISKILLFIPFIWNKKLNNLYNKYKLLWDKPNKGEKRKIKSITLRNISLISLFTTVFVIYLLIIGIIYSFR